MCLTKTLETTLWRDSSCPGTSSCFMKSFSDKMHLSERCLWITSVSGSMTVSCFVFCRTVIHHTISKSKCFFFILSLVPMAPELHLEPLNCTTILARWQLSPRNSASVQGYRLFYHEESQSERAPLQLRALDNTYTIGGLGEFLGQIIWVTCCHCGTWYPCWNSQCFSFSIKPPISL